MSSPMHKEDSASIHTTKNTPPTIDDQPQEASTPSYIDVLAIHGEILQFEILERGNNGIFSASNSPAQQQQMPARLEDHKISLAELLQVNMDGMDLSPSVLAQVRTRLRAPPEMIKRGSKESSLSSTCNNRRGVETDKRRNHR